MTIQELQNLTGVVVPDSDITRIKAVIRRSETKLESLLGYSLTKQNKWTELGKVRASGATPFPSLPVSDEVLSSLKDPDEETGSYQLFNFDELNTHIRINPAREVYRAKIVLPVNRNEFITIVDLQNGTPYLNAAGLVVAISRYANWYTSPWYSGLSSFHKANLMLAVDADYVNVCDANRYPDLAYLLADMVTYYGDSNYSVMGVIRSESIDSHSYSRASTGKTADEAAPEGQSTARLTIAKYAGPGAFRNLVK